MADLIIFSAWSVAWGDFATTAATPEKAISNIRWRIFGRSACAGRYMQNWTVRAVA